MRSLREKKPKAKNEVSYKKSRCRFTVRNHGERLIAKSVRVGNINPEMTTTMATMTTMMLYLAVFAVVGER